VSEEVNRKSSPRNTKVHTHSEPHNTHRHIQMDKETDGQIDRQTDDCIMPITDHRPTAYDRLKTSEYRAIRYDGDDEELTTDRNSCEIAQTIR